MMKLPSKEAHLYPVVVRLGAVEVAAGALSDHPPRRTGHGEQRLLQAAGRDRSAHVHALTETEVSATEIEVSAAVSRIVS